MTNQERSEIAALNASFNAFTDTYERDRREAKEWREAVNKDISEFKALRSTGRGVLLTLGVLFTTVAGLITLFWKWLFSAVTGTP